MMSLMTAGEAWLHEDRVLTVDDMADMPDDGRRYELDEGMLVVSPAPRNNHQWVVGRLHLLLSAACPPEFLVLPGVGINISRFQHRVPDIAVVTRSGFVMDEVFQASPPALVVEVASPSTARYDRTRKKDVYERFGVPAYWLVSPQPDKPELTAFELRDGGYVQVAHVAGGEAFGAIRPFALTVVPSSLVSTDYQRS